MQNENIYLIASSYYNLGELRFRVGVYEGKIMIDVMTFNKESRSRVARILKKDYGLTMGRIPAPCNTIEESLANCSYNMN